MYLLKREKLSEIYRNKDNSHSTMYLLKPDTRYLCELCVIFTFHHVSIKTIRSLQPFIVSSTFTFHHVSIKTLTVFIGSVYPCSFTFHHVSIKTRSRILQEPSIRHSHSTMYLLKLYSFTSSRANNLYSHSTMYLLKPHQRRSTKKEQRIHIPPCIY